MSPGTGEQVGKVTLGIVDALKGQPMVLALTIMNLALLAFMFYALHGSAQHRQILTEQVLKNADAIHDILKTRAVVCPPEQRQ